MIVILNSKTHVGPNPPSDTTKTWISADMTEIFIYPEPETYGRLNERIDVKAILLAHNLDIKSDRIRVFSLADDVLEVKRYIKSEWVVVDNPDNYVDIIMNGKVIGTMEVDSIAPDEQVDEWDGTGVVIEAIKTEEAEDELAGTWFLNDTLTQSPDITSSKSFDVSGTYNGCLPDSGTFTEGMTIDSVGLSVTDYYDFFRITGTEMYFADDLDSYDPVGNIYYRSHNPTNVLCVNCRFQDGRYEQLINTTTNGIKARTFTITSKLAEVTDGNILLTWLKANATK